MTVKINCPACSNLLYFPAFEECDENFLESICPACKYKYGLTQAEVTSFASQVEASQTNKSDKHPSYNRIYNLRLKQRNGKLTSLQFTTTGQLQKISALPGDAMLLLYVMRSKALADLVWLENVTTSEKLLLLKPGAKARSKGFRAGAMTLVTSGVVAIIMHIPTNKLFFAATVPAAVGVGVYVTKRNSLKVSDRLELERLASEQRLLLQKFELEKRTQELRQEFEAKSRLIGRLKGLRRRMLNAQEKLYANRVETVSKGIDILDKQLDLTQNLISGYTQIINMLAIEYETSRLAEHLPGDVSQKILMRLDELKAIETKKEELALLVNPQKLFTASEPD